MSNKKPFEFPESSPGCMSATPKKAAEIPEDFPITKCKPSRRGMKTNNYVRPRKAGRIISWEIAEALAPDAKLSYDEQVAKSEGRVLRHLSAEEAEAEALQEEIRKLKKENSKLKE